ncbi:CRISPR-associated helicase Cas3' [Rubrobacter indicoceani]|uniref:CRISPR-associated helicase Cas3' n=1 Tax=Rubrobacter indicoceani TaxID=2051957 RepID=UPI000E5C38AA|nr:CRISPR-associated helicase Cas3' [Rubrobacter indicoceani]
MNEKFYAHTPAEGSEVWHDLASHLERTSELAHENASKFGAGELGRLAGLWHDIGKFNPAFQGYLKACYEAELAGGKPPRAGSVPHAVYGAMFAAGAVGALAAVIHGHHAGLPNSAKMRDSLAKTEARDALDRILPHARKSVKELEFGGDVLALFAEPPADELQMEVLQRMVFSALVDADFLDTETHFDPEIFDSRGSNVAVGEMWKAFVRDQESLIAGFRRDEMPVNTVRREVYECCVEAAEDPTGIFRLAVPTGGGKTRSSLAFALRHATVHDLDRIIVAVPYTSIIEQTASVYRGIFRQLGDDAVLEHHSAVRREVDDERDLQDDPTEAERQEESRTRARLATENWDAPLIVTTTVQLLESLFANRTSRCRKLHNIAGSVIILDEVQALPAGLLTPTLSMLSELVRRYGVSVVLCTATQPAFEERSKYLQGFEEISDIVPQERVAEHFQTLRRVEYEISKEEWSWQEVATRLVEASSGRQAMAVLNTRKDALALIDALAREGEEESLLHLSTLLCGAHRRDVLEEVRRRLDAGEPCLLVSTQVVEAGVDLDFPVVFRAMGPLDRIVQAAGRCNREGKLPGMGRVVVFRPEERRMPRGEYEVGFGEAEVMLQRPDIDLHDPGIFREYFANLYRGVPTDGREIQKYRKVFDFPEVAARYRLISENTVPVVVRYGGFGKLDGELDALLDRIRYRGIRAADHRVLQPYVVSMFEDEFDRKKSWMLEVADGLHLWTGGYDELRGIEDIDGDPSALVW